MLVVVLTISISTPDDKWAAEQNNFSAIESLRIVLQISVVQRVCLETVRLMVEHRALVCFAHACRPVKHFDTPLACPQLPRQISCFNHEGCQCSVSIAGLAHIDTATEGLDASRSKVIRRCCTTGLGCDFGIHDAHAIAGHGIKQAQDLAPQCFPTSYIAYRNWSAYLRRGRIVILTGLDRVDKPIRRLAHTVIQQSLLVVAAHEGKEGIANHLTEQVA